MPLWCKGLMLLWLLSCLGCSTRPVVLLDSRQTPCLVPGQSPCQQRIIDAGYLREIAQRLDACGKR